MIDRSLTVQLYQSIADGNTDREFEMWHASSIAECPRAHYMKRLGVPSLSQPSASKILRWGAGHHIEKEIREHIITAFPDSVANQRYSSKEYSLTGEYDNYSKEQKALIEIKSVHDYAFIERDGELSLKEHDGFRVSKNGNKTNKWKPKTTPYEHHLLQNHAYKLLLEEEGLEVEKIYFIYITLSGRIVSYKTNVDESYTKNVKNRLATLNRAWEAQTPPDCICTPEHPLWGAVMQWCDYQEAEGRCCSTRLIDKLKEGEEE